MFILGLYTSVCGTKASAVNPPNERRENNPQKGVRAFQTLPTRPPGEATALK